MQSIMICEPRVAQKLAKILLQKTEVNIVFGFCDVCALVEKTVSYFGTLFTSSHIHVHMLSHLHMYTCTQISKYNT